MNKKISLPFGGVNAGFEVIELINYYNLKKTNFLIIGAAHVTLGNHKKVESFDFWLRNHRSVQQNHKNTCQATSAVINQLTNFSQFTVGRSKCPTSKRICKSLILTIN